MLPEDEFPILNQSFGLGDDLDLIMVKISPNKAAELSLSEQVHGDL